jgi:hypothetical protein
MSRSQGAPAVTPADCGHENLFSFSNVTDREVFEAIRGLNLRRWGWWGSIRCWPAQFFQMLGRCPRFCLFQRYLTRVSCVILDRSVCCRRCLRLWRLACVLIWFIDGNRLLSPYQFGFRLGHSTVIVTWDWWRFFSCWISPRRSTMFGTLCCWESFHSTLSSGILRRLWLVRIFQIDFSMCLRVEFFRNRLRLLGVWCRVLCWDFYSSIDFCRFHMNADDVQLYLSDDPCSLDECWPWSTVYLDRWERPVFESWEISSHYCDGSPGFHAAAVQPVSM